jgi:hypothetical protein
MIHSRCEGFREGDGLSRIILSNSIRKSDPRRKLVYDVILEAQITLVRERFAGSLPIELLVVKT